jgi:hypothetical protein
LSTTIDNPDRGFVTQSINQLINHPLSTIIVLINHPSCCHHGLACVVVWSKGMNVGKHESRGHALNSRTVVVDVVVAEAVIVVEPV